jgi:hypothetical protein
MTIINHFTLAVLTFFTYWVFSFYILLTGHIHEDAYTFINKIWKMVME